MKISERWLREWIDPGVDTATLVESLNMAGLECEARPLLEDPPRGVVVGLVTAVRPHPGAKNLRLCEVDTGDGSLRQIVCGAPNVRSGMRAPVALSGSKLPGGKSIVEVELRGVRSAGMLCSSGELGLIDSSDGLMELDPDTPLGLPIEHHLQLDDWLLDFDLTPNRGDCLSAVGLAREISALHGQPIAGPAIGPSIISAVEKPSVRVLDTAACPHYVARIVRDLDSSSRTPDWMRERLRRSGVRLIHPLVDVTNYVMLELGQPLHAFDLGGLQGGITVRPGRQGEKLSLLNEQSIDLQSGDLVVADDGGAVALAGVMGGTRSAVNLQTTSILLESAYFAPASIAESGRRHRILSDSRYRFERGVDPALQQRAIERATALIQDICGGSAGPNVEIGTAPEHGAQILLRRRKVDRVLGMPIAAEQINDSLGRLGITLRMEDSEAWKAYAPTYRHDLRLEVDLIEEIARIQGYDNIPERATEFTVTGHSASELERSIDVIKDRLADRGYCEIVTYSFVDPRLQDLLSPDAENITLDNPIAETMAVMRSTLWSGLLTIWQYNRQRQRERARLFEAGNCFTRDGEGDIRETMRVAGLLCGTAAAEQWGLASRPSDFYDLKGDVESLFQNVHNYEFEAATHPALHPGRSARIRLGDFPCGWLGELNPTVCRRLDLIQAPLLFELDWSALNQVSFPRYTPLSGQPCVRRDLALLVRQEVTAQSLIDAVREGADVLLQEIRIFDIYEGKNLPQYFKSVALGLIFQDRSSTLTDEQVEASVRRITAHLEARLGVSLRGA